MLLIVVVLSLSEFFGEKDQVFVLFEDAPLTWLKVNVIRSILWNLQVLEV